MVNRILVHHTPPPFSCDPVVVSSESGEAVCITACLEIVLCQSARLQSSLWLPFRHPDAKLRGHRVHQLLHDQLLQHLLHHVTLRHSLPGQIAKTGCQLHVGLFRLPPFTAEALPVRLLANVVPAQYCLLHLTVVGCISGT